MKFTYTALPGNSDKTLRPLLQATLSYKNKTTSRLFFLVDSGADVSYVDKDIAIWLGNSTFISYPSKTTLSISGHTLTIPVFYTENLGYQCILGQEVVFNKVRVIFERYKRQFELIPKYI